MRPPRALLAFSLLLVLLLLVPSQLPAVTGAAIPFKCKESDVTERTNNAPLVLEATVHSTIPQQNSYKIHVLKKYKGGPINKIIKEEDKPYVTLLPDKCDTTNSLQIDSKYLVFAKISKQTLSAIGPPLPATEEALRIVRKITAKKSAKKKPPKITGLKDKTLIVNETLELLCRVTGRGSKKVNYLWFKDGKKIKDKRVKIKSRKRETRLTIKIAKPEDRGEYECRAKLGTGEQLVEKAIIRGPDIKRYDSEPCSEELKDYCLNNGVCLFVKDIGERYCECAEGFIGSRCLNKHVINSDVPKEALGIDVSTRTLSLYWGKK